MDQQQLNIKINQVIEQVSRRQKPVRRIWSSLAIFCIANAVRAAYYAPFFALSIWLTERVSENSVHQAFWFAFSILLFVGGPFFVNSYLKEHTSYGESVPILITLKIFDIFGISTELTKTKSEEIVKWTQEHPWVRALCIEWAAQNVGNLFTLKEYLILKHADKRIKRYQKKHADWTYRIKYKQETEQVFEMSGMMEEVKARSEEIALNKRTPHVQTEETPRRI